MSEYTISLAFSVWHHYLKQFTEKHQISLPIFPEQLKKVDISHFLPKAEEIVLGKLPEIRRKTLPCSKGIETAYLKALMQFQSRKTLPCSKGIETVLTLRFRLARRS